jgi:peptidyl-tRNA hydrolase, PTH1 family
MYLIVGLGNPEKKYATNRHNVGFQLADRLSETYGFSAPRAKFNAIVSEGRIGDHKALIMKPQTFYNESGRAVSAAAKFYKIPVENIIALHDELDLAPGKIKLKFGGGAAGNNGLKSITAHMGDGFLRVRIGIGHPGDKNKVTQYVLSDFSKAERAEWVDETLDALAAAMPILLESDRPQDEIGSRFLSDIAMRLGKPAPQKATPRKQPKPDPATDISASEKQVPQKTEKKDEGPLAHLLRGLFGADDNNKKKED